MDKKRKIKKNVIAVSMIVWLVLTRMCAYSILHEESLMLEIDSGGLLKITFFIFPFLMLGALYGYVISSISFTISFVIKLFFEMDEAYYMAIYLVATICFSLFSQFFWFKTKKKTLGAAIITLALTGVTEYACFAVLPTNTFDFSDFWKFGVYVSRDCIIIFISAFLMHFYFTKVPDIFKLFFPLGIGYTKAYENDHELKRGLRKTKVSVKITTIIIGVEVILGIFVGIFMMALFPDVKSMMINTMNETELSNKDSDSDIETDDSSIAEKLGNVGYRFNSEAIIFDIKMMLLMLCVGVPMASFANYYTKRSIGEPLGRISDFMENFAGADDNKRLEVGRRVDDIKVRTQDEIKVVYDSVRSTVYSIEDYIKRIKAEQELQKELEVAKQASEAKSSFLSNMSHEIRTPINAVLGMNEMIIRESDDRQILEYAQNVKSAGTSLLGIVNDILDFSKIEAGKMDILPVQYQVGSMINDLLNMISAKAQDKGLDLEINVDGTMPTTLVGDEVRIKQCVTNVLTNAVKYTEHGTVTMNVSYKKIDEDNIMLGFQVVDTGIGIKEEDLSKLFSPFERIEEIRNRTIEGTGLGMSIVKKLLAMMDTKLVVKSVYGEGSDFSFEVRQQVDSWEELGDFKKRYQEYLQSLEKYHEKFKAPDAEILVVDDTVMNLTVVKGLLKNTQIKVDTAESGKETLEKVTKKKYDAIFIDHRMPEMDGIETLAAMKVLEGNLCKDVPCVALTANAGAGAREEYLAAGFDDYLSKPVNGEILEDMLKELLPKEKILSAAEINETQDNIIDTSDFLNDLQGISLEEALTNCGSREVLIDVAKEFLISIDSKADSIEKYALEKDYRNYTVFVHALKSSARLIGAMQLSEQAAYLEKCGNEENEIEIENKTPDLLKLYRSYKDKLSAASDKENADLSEIDPVELTGALSDMKELVEAYDFDTADGIMKMLEEYKIPDDYSEKFGRIKELMAAVDRDGLLEIL